MLLLCMVWHLMRSSSLWDGWTYPSEDVAGAVAHRTSSACERDDEAVGWAD